jgi:hypothetical protein
MTKQNNNDNPKGEIVAIPKTSTISGKISVHDDNRGRFIWSTGGSIAVFGMAAALIVLPLLILALLLSQPETSAKGLTWLWISMTVIEMLVAGLVAFGMVRHTLEADM